jgi:hypothetical protein
MRAHGYRVVLLLLATLVGCKPAAPNYNYVTLGMVVDRTGPLALPSTDDTMGFTLEQMNTALAQAGYKDLQFNYVVLDDSRDNATVAAEKAVEVVQVHNAKVILTDSSTADVAINGLHYDANPDNDPNVPIICGLCGTSNINETNATDANPVRQATLSGTSARSSRIDIWCR